MTKDEYQKRLYNGYGTMQQINNNRSRGNQLMQRSMQVVPGLQGIGSQLGGALSQMINAYAGSKLMKQSNEQENALLQALSQAAVQHMGGQQPQDQKSPSYPNQQSMSSPQAQQVQQLTSAPTQTQIQPSKGMIQDQETIDKQMPYGNYALGIPPK